MAEERFLRMKSGAVYRYSPALAKRRDAVLVDGFAAARHYRSIGVKNDITEKYPEREMDEGAIPPAPRRPPRDQSKRTRGAKAAVVVSDSEGDTAAIVEELLGNDAKDVS
jgi:hypothetical protein